MSRRGLIRGERRNQGRWLLALKTGRDIWGVKDPMSMCAETTLRGMARGWLTTLRYFDRSWLRGAFRAAIAGPLAGSWVAYRHREPGSRLDQAARKVLQCPRYGPRPEGLRKRGSP